MKSKAEVVDSNFSISEFRKSVDIATAKMKMPKGVMTKEETINSFQAEWIIPEKPTEGKVLLYIHGGGFISGSCKTHRVHAAKFAKGSNRKAYGNRFQPMLVHLETEMQRQGRR